MMRSVFLKARMADKEKAKDVLLFLGATFIETKNLTYHYVQMNKTTVKFLRTDEEGKSFLFTCQTTDDDYSIVTKTPVEHVEDAKQELASKYGDVVSFVKRKTLYRLKDVEIAFSTIEGLGTFLEFESDQHSYQELKQYIKKFGLSNKDIVATTYNQLLKKQKLSVKR